MTSFIIKIIACITMVLDHIKYAIPETECVLTTYFGRLAFPLFAFLLVEGYSHTSDLKKYYKRLCIFALISQVPFMMFRTLVGDWKLLNIMFTLLLGLIAITILDKVKRKWISIPVALTLIVLGKFIKVDYGWFGVATVVILYLCRNKKIILPYEFGALVALYYYTMLKWRILEAEYFFSAIFAWISVLLMAMYNGKQGRKMKYFFYWFYPVHMIIIYLVSLI